jgi:YHS domain-containing protein
LEDIIVTESKSATKDPICGMTVDELTALKAERDGKTFYFCGDRCRQAFLSDPTGAENAGKPRCCCGE